MDVSLVIALLLLGVFVLRFRGEPRRLSNGVWLIAGLGILILWGLGQLGRTGDAGALVAGAILFLGPPLLVFVVAVFLIADGVILLRRERLRPANMLSLLAGIGIVVVVVAVAALTVVAYREQRPAVFVPALSLLAVAGYVGFVFTVVLLYAFVYSRVRAGVGHTGIIVLGAGVPQGRVTPLLASRLNKAAELYQVERAAGYEPLLVASGGQGADEPVSEAHAMAAYLRANHDIPDDALVEEDRSTNTRENLQFSRQLLPGHDEERLLVVTSNYHVLRAALLTRRLRVPALVRGARTARYYVPNAFLREFVALMVEHKLLHATFILLAAAGPPLLYLAAS